MDYFPLSPPHGGTLSIVTRPRGGEWLADEIRDLRAHDVNLLVSLLTPDEVKSFELEQEGSLAENQGIHHINFPIRDRDVPDSRFEFIALLHQLKSALDEGRHLAVHCRQSIGRSSLVAAGLLQLMGLPLDDALRQLSAARGVEVPETLEQKRWLRSLPALFDLEAG